MSKLEELIEELCPVGVEYKKLGDVATITRGGNFQKKDYVENGIPCIHYGQIYTQYGLFVNETISFISEEKAKKQKMANTDDIIMAVTSENIDDVCKCVAWLGKGEIAVSGHTAIIQHSLNPKYLVYYFHSMMFYKQKTKLAHGTKVIEVTPNKLVNIIIPVPPLQVQSEIVRILDNFTELTAKLKAELKAELTARKKQYEYYRNEIMSLKHLHDRKTIIEISLGDIYDFQYGKGNVIPTSGGDYPVYGSNGIVGTHSEYNSEDSPVIGHIGAYAGIVNWGYGKHFVTYNGVICKLKNDSVDSRYAYYLLLLQDFGSQAKSSSQPFVSYDILNKPIVLIPGIEEQQRIVAVLDRFYTLCNDISTGLPAEIEARTKQYEYYRDKLLTFKQLS
jgi:type I restriction enzyme, S subunit